MGERQPDAPTGDNVSCIQRKRSTATLSARERGELRRISTSQEKSGSCAAQSNGSNVSWQKPKTIKELAANINEVANAVLNGEIDLRTAQVYGALVRVVAQATSLEVTRGRFLKEMPDLGLEIEEASRG